MRLTDKQQEIHDFLCGYAQARRMSPTIGEIQKRFQLRSPATVHQVLSALVKKGFIRRTPNVARGIEILQVSDTTEVLRIPLRGMVSAGKPIEPVETYDP